VMSAGQRPGTGMSHFVLGSLAPRNSRESLQSWTALASPGRLGRIQEGVADM
jgi:hypothetical protein